MMKRVGLSLLALVVICASCYVSSNVLLNTVLFPDPESDQGQCTFVLTPTPAVSSPLTNGQPVTIQAPPHEQLVPIGASNGDRIVELSRMGHGKIKAVHWSPGKQLLVLTSTGMWTYDPAFAATRPELLWMTDKQLEAIFSPDGTMLATMTGSQQLSITLLNAETGNEVRTLRLSDGRTENSINPFEDGLNRMIFSPDGSLLAASERGTVYIWDTRTSGYVRSFTGFTNWLYSLAFRADSKVLAAGGVDTSHEPGPKNSNLIRIWDIATGSIIATLKGDELGVDRIALSPDGTTLVTRDGSYSEDHLRFFDIAAGVQRFVISIPSSVASDVQYSADGSKLIFGTRVFDAQRGLEVAALGDGDSLIPGNNKMYVSVFADGISLWSGDQQPAKLKTLQDFAHPDDVDYATFNAKGYPVFYRNRRPVGGWPRQTEPTIAFSTIGSRAAYESQYGSDGPWFVRLCDTGHGKQVTAIRGGQPVFSPDGKTLATSDLCGLQLWDSISGTQLKSLVTDNCATSAITFSPDGSLVAFASGYYRTDYSLIELWDVRTGKRLTVLKGHTDGITSIAFAPDSTLLISTSADGTIRLWGISSP